MHWIWEIGADHTDNRDSIEAVDGDTALLAYLAACHADERYDPVRQKSRRFVGCR